MKDKTQQNLNQIPAFSEAGHLHAVIEVPAGTNVKWEYQPEAGEFSASFESGRPRVVEFLPYPSNYGFVPSTLMREEEGGDGDPLDIIVLAESKARGEVVEVVPLAMLRLVDNGREDHKILSIPEKESERLFSASKLQDVPEAVLQILEIWFMNYKDRSKLQNKGWVGAAEAMQEVKKWLTS